MRFELTKWYLGKVLPYHLATPAREDDYSSGLSACQVLHAPCHNASFS